MLDSVGQAVSRVIRSFMLGLAAGLLALAGVAFLTAPAHACGFEAPSLAPGAPADLVITRARSWTELFARPQTDRIVLRAGRAIDRTLPDYAELDDLMEPA